MRHFLIFELITNSERMKIDSVMEQLFSHHFEAVKNGTNPLPTDFECYRNLVNFYDEKCGRLSDYGMKYLKLMVAECESIKAFPAALDSTKHRIEKVCKNPIEWN